MVFSMASLCALGALSADRVIGNVVTTGIVAVVVAVLTSVITIRVLGTKLNRLAEDVSALASNDRAQDKALAAMHAARAECELRAVHSFAEKETLIRMMADDRRAHEELLGRMDGLHGRVTELKTAFHEFKGRVEGGDTGE